MVRVTVGHAGIVCAVMILGCGRLRFGDVDPQQFDGAVGDDASTNDLVLWLQMDDDPVDGVADMSAFGHQVRCNTGQCPSVVPAIRGNGYDFDGVDDELFIPYHASFDTMQEFTISFWAEVDVYPSSSFKTFIGRPLGIGNRDAYTVSVPNDGAVVFYTASTASGMPDMGEHILYGYGAILPVAAWRHIACVYSGGQKQLYVGGVLADEEFGGAVLLDVHDLSIGSDWNSGGPSPTYYIDGRIDDFRFYNRALPMPELVALWTP